MSKQPPETPAKRKHEKEDERGSFFFIFFHSVLFPTSLSTLSIAFRYSSIVAAMLLAASCSALLRRGAQRASPAALSVGASAAARSLQTQALPDLPYEYK